MTFADACEASPEPARGLMTGANASLSCSRLIRLATGVVALENAVQLAAITAAVELLDDAGGGTLPVWS